MAQILLAESMAPSTPSTGKVAIYAKTDGFLYSKDDTGVEARVSVLIGVNVQAYDAATAKLNVAQTWTATQHIPGGGAIATNEALGTNALPSNTTGSNNTACGANTLYNNTTGSNNTAIGYRALYSNTTYNNCSGLGANTAVTGNNQIQLGNSATTTYVYGIVHNRSDIRDKADIRDTVLGLEFINALRPVDYKLDMRDDYKTDAPDLPAIDKPAEDASEDDIAAYESAVAEQKLIQEQWLESMKLGNITHDGSKKRKRYHHGLIAQEVSDVIIALGVDFGGYQDHALSGGDDVKSIGYVELIAPLIKAVQELSAKVAALEVKNV